MKPDVKPEVLLPKLETITIFPAVRHNELYIVHPKGPIMRKAIPTEMHHGKVKYQPCELINNLSHKQYKIQHDVGVVYVSRTTGWSFPHKTWEAVIKEDGEVVIPYDMFEWMKKNEGPSGGPKFRIIHIQPKAGRGLAAAARDNDCYIAHQTK